MCCTSCILPIVSIEFHVVELHERNNIPSTYTPSGVESTSETSMTTRGFSAAIGGTIIDCQT